MKVTKGKDSRTGKTLWRADFSLNRRRYRLSADTRAELDEIIDHIRRAARRGKHGVAADLPPVRLGELVEARAADFDPSKKNHRRNKNVLERFRRHFADDALVERLTAADLLAFKRARVAESRLKPNSVNRELEAVAAMFNRAGVYFPRLESWKPPRMPYERTGGRGRERVLTAEEAAALLSALRGERRRGETRGAAATRAAVADMVEVALLTGMRRGEIQNLRWDFINRRERVITLPARLTKTKTSRTVPINSTLWALLERRKSDSPLVFTNNRGGGPMAEFQFYRCLRNAAERAGLSYGRRAEGGFCFHDLRHTAATRMLHGGGDVATVADVLGHSQKTMTLRYAHATVESKRRAVASLEAFGADATEGRAAG